MDKNENLLTTIYQASKTGADNTNAILPSVEDTKQREVIFNTVNQYDTIAKSASEKLYARGAKIKSSGTIKESVREMSVKMMASINNSPSHIAEMMVNGANMGIIELTKAQNDAPDASPDIYQLSNEFISMSKKLIDDMKTFL